MDELGGRQVGGHSPLRSPAVQGACCVSLCSRLVAELRGPRSLHSDYVCAFIWVLDAGV